MKLNRCISMAGEATVPDFLTGHPSRSQHQVNRDVDLVIIQVKTAIGCSRVPKIKIIFIASFVVTVISNDNPLRDT